ncbi:site-specific tyrosine recombinase/integron integrase [Alkalibacillus aidingensis]|uniref:site-specific tyrosine recombinase/integron integrase n=1 Tax=Alkalibacillus aidingensis TaxID=2747607 RepID=UPI00166152EF|nr:site-specific tyrosine recombinase/integron integrase [Alkalibacillus aidingensis]
MTPQPDYWKSTNENITQESLAVLNEYLLSLKLSNKSQATIEKYKWVLEQFFTSCSTPIEQLTSDEVLSWMNQFTKEKKPRTVDLIHSTLSSFFQFCLAEDYMDQRVMKKRWRPKIPQALPKYLSEHEYARVLLEIETLPIRDRALMLFLFSTGCRSFEVTNLVVSDVDIPKRTAQVTGKGKRIRTVHFSVECQLALKDYLATRTTKDEDPLFLNKFGQPLGKSGIYKITTELGKRAGISHSLHPHCCRHTFATMMMARGANIEFIADELGHSNLNTTRVYARIPTEDMKMEYQNKMG